MAMIKKLAVIAGAAEAARRYAKKNPAKTSKYLDQAAQFVDKQTKGKYSGQIDGVTQKAKGVAGIHAPGSTGTSGYTSPPGSGTDANGQPNVNPATPSPERRPGA